jgi:hypothetical protein
MSEEQQVAAIGRAVQAAAASKKKMLALEAEIEHASESFKIAHEALDAILKRSEGRDIHKALKALPDVQKLKDLVREFEEAAGKHSALAARARELSDL